MSHGGFVSYDTFDRIYLCKRSNWQQWDAMFSLSYLSIHPYLLLADSFGVEDAEVDLTKNYK